MSAHRFVFEQLGKLHNRAAFSSGVDELDRYFRERAGQDQGRRIAAVHVLHDTEHDHVVGYYTLSATYVRLADLPESERKKLPRYPELPATLIGRLAVDHNYRGQRFGQGLLMDALRRSYLNSSEIGAMAVAVDPIDENAAAFYVRYGFRRHEGAGDRLFIPMRDIAKLVQLIN